MSKYVFYSWDSKKWNEIHSSTPIESYKWYYDEVKKYLGNILYQGKVLDLGIGKGRLYNGLSGIDLTGVDFSKSALDFAKHLYPNGNYILSDFRNIPLPDNEFDLVILMGVLSPDDEELNKDIIKEAKRVVKPDGKIFVSVYVDKLPTHQKLFSTNKKIENNRDEFHFFFLNKGGEYGNIR